MSMVNEYGNASPYVLRYDAYRGRDVNTKEIREMLGISRAEFARKYGIPIRTVENWDAGVRTPPDWVLAMLERIVREDAEEIGHEIGHDDEKMQ